MNAVILHGRNKQGAAVAVTWSVTASFTVAPPRLLQSVARRATAAAAHCLLLLQPLSLDAVAAAAVCTRAGAAGNLHIEFCHSAAMLTWVARPWLHPEKSSAATKLARRNEAAR
jgi:hypothetical protein